MKKINKSDEELKSLIGKLHQAEMSQLPSKEELQGRYRLSETFDQKMNRLIQKQKSKAKRTAYAGYVAAAAAVVVLLFSIFHPQYLVEARKQFMKWFDNHAEFHFKDETSLTEMPKYEMGYVPEGFELVEDNYYEMGMGLVVYQKGEEVLYLDYEVSDANSSINNEGVTFTIITGNRGDTIFYFCSEDKSRLSTMTWLSEDGNISFTIAGIFDKEEMLKMQESVKKCE